MTPQRWARAARLLLLLAACSAGLLALRAERRSASDRAEAAYACPMHPAVTSSTPGDCPLCGMALVSRALPGIVPAAAAPLAPGSVDLPRRRVLSHQPTVAARVLSGGALQAIVYDDDLAVLAADERGRFRPAAEPERGVEVVRSSATPLRWDASTHRVLFLGSGRESLVPGTVGWLELPERTRPALVVPSSAVLEEPEGPVVLALGGEGEGFRRIPVAVGRSPVGNAVVLAGLRPSERILIRGAFFVDAAERLGSPADAAH